VSILTCDGMFEGALNVRMCELRVFGEDEVELLFVIAA